MVDYPVRDPLTGPPSHWSPFSFVTPSSANPNGPPSHWFPISLVPQLISPHLIGPPISTHASPIPLVPHLIGPPDSLVPHLNGPPSHWTLLTGWVPTALFELIGPPSPNITLSALHLIGPPILHFLPCSHRSPIALVPQCNLVYTVLIGPRSHWSPNATLITQFSLVPSSHWSPNVTLVIQFSLVPHLIGPPM